MSTIQETLISVERLKTILVSRAIGQEPDGNEYVALRKSLIAHPMVKDRLPRFIHTCRTIPEFWAYIQPKFKSYRERQAYLAEEFDSLLTRLESANGNPALDVSSEVLSVVDCEHVQQAWQKAIDRRTIDPDGAITMARTLLETVCKYILGEQGIAFDECADLPKLYKFAAEQLNLAPSQHTEAIVKQILGGCCAVVEGIGALRNRVGDAHGKSKLASKPQPRHAALTVNLAGSLATFLVETWRDRKQK